MSASLSRLFNPKSIAVLGGQWGEAVVSGLKTAGYGGKIWPVHPRRNEVCGIPCFATLENLPAAPDASFIAVNRRATIDAVSILSGMGAGGAVCFASGFRESEQSDADACGLQDQLVKAAGSMPILGPNCYGFVNYLDAVPIWPDQHGGERVTSGVAIIAQSSNIAINMTMQRRSLALAAMVTVGNQAQTEISDLAVHFLNDPRITAVGLYIEGFGNIRKLEKMAGKARQLGKPIIALKVGRSEKSRSAVMTHSASLSGDTEISSAVMRQLGIIEVRTPEAFLESLKLLHLLGPLPGRRVVSISCSGGEAGLMGDLGHDSEIEFSDFSVEQKNSLRESLGPLVTLSNPFDYHTFIWGDVARMTETFTIACEGFDLGVMVLDLPRSDRCERQGYRCAVDAILATARASVTPLAVLSLYPENLDEALAAEFHADGVATLNGMTAGIEAIDAGIRAGLSVSRPVPDAGLVLRDKPVRETWLDEHRAKQLLAAHGIRVPRGVRIEAGKTINPALLSGVNFSVALKGLGFVHKSENNAVATHIADYPSLVERMGAINAPDGYLIEEMIEGNLCELLVGLRTDDSGLVSLTLGAGGVLTELLGDTTTLVLPVSAADIELALQRTKVGRLCSGYRGRPKVDTAMVAAEIARICDVVIANEDVSQVEINPLIVRLEDCVAVDAAICETAQE